MKKSIKYIGVIILGLICFNQVKAQTVWEIPAEQKAETLKIPFNEANQEAGAELFNTNCKVCHNETQIAPKNTRQWPVAPNLGSQEIQKNNTDGEFFYKITNGLIKRNMPAFPKLSEDEKWKIVTYLRTFYPDYQPPANAGAIAGPAAEKFVGTIKGLTLSFDTATGFAIANLTAIDIAGMATNAMNVKVNFYLKRSFAPLLIGTIKTDANSTAKIEFPAEIPADTNGLITVIAEVEDGKISKTMEVKYGEKLVFKSPLDNEEMWGTRKMAPLWLKLMYLSAVIGVWLVIGWAGFQLFRIFNLRER